MLEFSLRQPAARFTFIIAVALSGCGDDVGPRIADLGADVAVSLDGTASPDGAASPDALGSADGVAVDLVTPDIAQIDTGAPYVHANLSVSQAWKLIQSKAYTLLDVREPYELSTDGYIAGAVNLPYTSGKLASGHATLPKGKGIVVYCRSGNRSSKSAPFLTQKGFKPVYNVVGGFTAWKAAGLPWTQ